MRQGYSPTQACKKAVERIAAVTPRDKKNIQVGFIAISKKGQYGGYALKKGFDYGVSLPGNGCIQMVSDYIL
jgi:N4-(beta-N-acetylglucosaminyl)-L-asparaginase